MRSSKMKQEHSFALTGNPQGQKSAGHLVDIQYLLNGCCEIEAPTSKCQGKLS